MQDASRAMAGSADRRAFVGGNRYAGVLGIPRTGHRRFPEIHRPNDGEARRCDALESARPKMAPIQKRLSTRQENGLETGGARRTIGNALRSCARWAVFV